MKTPTDNRQVSLVQVLRLFTVWLLLPPLYSLMKGWFIHCSPNIPYTFLPLHFYTCNFSCSALLYLSILPFNQKSARVQKPPLLQQLLYTYTHATAHTQHLYTVLNCNFSSGSSLNPTTRYAYVPLITVL